VALRAIGPASIFRWSAGEEPAPRRDRSRSREDGIPDRVRAAPGTPAV